MDQKSQELLQAALTLPEVDRATIAEALLETLSPEHDEWDDAELAAELDRRLKEARHDPTTTVPWTELKDSR
jgi:putative addiction module component (TIGR02574 family)